MTDQQPEVPWSEPAPEEQTAYERYEAAAGDRYYNVPARSPEMRGEYDRQEEAEREVEAAEERNIHFFGHYPTDPYVEHGEYCVDSCPTTHRSRLGNGQSARPAPKLAKPSTRALRPASKTQARNHNRRETGQ